MCDLFLPKSIEVKHVAVIGGLEAAVPGVEVTQDPVSRQQVAETHTYN